MPRYYSETKANLKNTLLPSFRAGEAVGRLMVAAARGQRAARELMALRDRWAEELGKVPDHQAVNALDYKGISELAENPILSDRDLEALGMLLQRISQLQAENGLTWEYNRLQTGEWLERLARKIDIIAEGNLEPERIKDLLEDLASEVEKVGRILSQTVPWEEPRRREAWEARKKTEERINDLADDLAA